MQHLNKENRTCNVSPDSDSDQGSEMLLLFSARIKRHYQTGLLNKALDALAFHAALSQRKREMAQRAELHHRESLLIKAFLSLILHQKYFQPLDRFRQHRCL